MAILKARLSGIWVETSQTGSVRYEGSTVPYGPSEGPSFEAINWTAEPTLTDASDGTTYVMGCRFSVLASKPCYGIRWRVTDTLTPAPVAGYTATLFSISPTVKLAQEVFTPVAGGYQDILFTTPVTLDPGLQYTVSILTQRYSFRSAGTVGGFPFSSASGNVVADVGKLSETTDPNNVPAGDFASIYYVSPLVGT